MPDGSGLGQLRRDPRLILTIAVDAIAHAPRD
jgi:hypothetical protein